MDRRRFVGQGALGLASLLMAGRGGGAERLQEKPSALIDAQKPLSCLAFGSCNRSLLDQSYWKLIAREQPDLWVWLGDTIYADGALPDQRRAMFQDLFRNPHYTRFRQQVPIIGTWDDHDFAGDNQDGRFRDKLASKNSLLEFLEIPEDHPVWGHQGVYQSYSYGPQGQKTQVILLDLRFNMDRQKNVHSLLGDLQWAWLEAELKESDADLIVIGSSLNVLSPVNGLGLEGWHGFRQDKARLLELLSACGKPTVLLSGDRHFAEFAATRLSNGLPVYEIMSSGLTHALGIKLPHSERIGEMVGLKNFGLVHISWETNGPKITLELRSTERYQSLQAIHAPFTEV